MLTAKQLLEMYENENGTLNIYSEGFTRDFLEQFRNTNAFTERFYINNKHLFDNIFQSSHDANQYLDKLIADDASKFMYNLFHESRILNWASSSAFLLLKRLGYKCEPLEIGIVSLPSFNASLFSPQHQNLDKNLIALSYHIFMYSIPLNAYLWRIDEMEQEKDKGLFNVARRLKMWMLEAFGDEMLITDTFAASDHFELQKSISNSLIQILFIVLHELGHVIEQDHSQTDPGEKEIAADRFAVKALLSDEFRAIVRETSEIIDYSAIVPVSMTFLFSIFNFMERCGIKTSGTHPPAEERFFILQEEMWGSAYDDSNDLVKDYFYLFDSVLDFIEAEG